MKKLLVGFFLVVVSQFSFAADTPTARVEAGVADIIRIATDKEATLEQKRAELEGSIGKHVDLQASAQRVIAKHWRKASKEDKVAFLKIFRSVLVNTYINLLEQYTDQKVVFKNEEIKKQKYATVDAEIVSGDLVIPVSFRLYFRNDDWKIYDLVPEGISMIRSFSNDYQGTLKKDGLAGLNTALAAKLKSATAAAPAN